jgi:hypothetical protein
LKIPLKKTPDLSAEAAAWIAEVTSIYGLADDPVAQLLLRTAMQAMDRMLEAQRHIEQHGAVTLDRFGQLRPNPSVTIERDARAAMLAAIKALSFDLEPLNGAPGRPPEVY